MTMIEKIGARKYLVFLLLYLGWCISFIDRTAISISATHIIKDLAISPVKMGAVLSMFYIGYTIMQIPGGWLADKIGSKKVILVAVALWSVFTILTGMVESLMALLVIRLLFGLGEGGFPPASFKSVAENFSGVARSNASSAMVSSNYIGSMIAPLIVAPLILAFDWRNTFMIIGGIGFIYIFLFAFLTPSSKAVRQQVDHSKTASSLVLKNKYLWTICAMWFGISIVNKGLDTWMPIYLMTERGLNLKAVGWLLPIPFLIAGLTTAVGGWIVNKYFDGKERRLIIPCCILMCLGLYEMYSAATIAQVIIAQGFVYLFKSLIFALVIALPAKKLPQEQIGRGLGIINTGGMAAGFVAPVIIGALVTWSGYHAVFMFLIGAVVFSLFMSFWIKSQVTPRLHKELSQA
ncbi:MFS transporter [Acinetobacter sp. MB5]|uniref:MFS transporter n=1 Tax=Acinetobacter sp. MB5 TaxID=2069438 RepID=UPI000DCF746E|nr:MFS transporter [Acinetobacter sp. MB5]